jgi:hypothetical protein
LQKYLPVKTVPPFLKGGREDLKLAVSGRMLDYYFLSGRRTAADSYLSEFKKDLAVALKFSLEMSI